MGLLINRVCFLFAPSPELEMSIHTLHLPKNAQPLVINVSRSQVDTKWKNQTLWHASIKTEKCG